VYCKLYLFTSTGTLEHGCSENSSLVLFESTQTLVNEVAAWFAWEVVMLHWKFLIWSLKSLYLLQSFNKCSNEIIQESRVRNCQACYTQKIVRLLHRHTNEPSCNAEGWHTQVTTRAGGRVRTDVAKLTAMTSELWETPTLICTHGVDTSASWIAWVCTCESEAERWKVGKEGGGGEWK